MAFRSIRYLSFLRLYLWEDFGSANVVDVLDDQGRLQNGAVTGIAENGLLVDFFCKGQAPRVVEYDRLFHCSRLSVCIGSAINVQVLVRISDDMPFTWAPAKLMDPLINLLPPRLVEVELELDGHLTKEIVHTLQIRRARASGYLEIVEKNNFGTGSCPVPEQYAVAFSELSPLWMMCNRDLSDAHDVLLMHIRSENVEYLSAAEGTAIPDLKHCLDEAVQRMDSCRENGLMWSGRFFTQTPVPVLPDDQSTPVQLPSLLSFPAHLMVEIFQFLESADRVRQRRVSARWDDVLRKALFKDVWVSLKRLYDCPLKWSAWDSLHALVLVMTKLVTKATRWMIIAGNADSCQQHDMGKSLQIIADVTGYFDIPCAGQLNVVVSQHTFPWDGMPLQVGVADLEDVCTQLAFICDSLVWKDCIFQNPSVEESRLPVRTGSMKFASPSLQSDLWEVLDKSSPETDLDEISRWLAEGIHTEDVHLVLKEFQIPDPRLHAQSTLYGSDELANKKPCELDVRRLTRLTQWALSAKMAETNHSTEHSSEESSEKE